MHVPAIFGIGRNYAAHVSEMQSEVSSKPIVFMKNPGSLCSNGSTILIPNCCRDEPQVDFEGELAIQISEDCRNVSIETASSFIAGYAVANDVSARQWQKSGSGGQWTRGKSFDTFCPMTTFVPSTSIANPHNLTIRTILNGELMQDANTSEMIFQIPNLISELSQDMTMLAGTIILTGTPAGVGVARTPQRFLRAGDVVEVIIDEVGHLTNDVQYSQT